MNLFAIDRKVLAGGLGGVLSWAIFAAALAWLHLDLTAYVQPVVDAIFAIMGVTPAPSAQGGIAILIGGLIAYLTPPAEKDILKRLNDAIVARALVDPAVKVTSAGTSAAMRQMSPVVAPKPPGG